ncbi:hypothetical protein ISP15_18095 [Dyella jejuensis]|uniref:PH domain-containing protein n=1 Tax=Dyella jejuensis TaxID=1432009 RepID=A0ABW8JP51_9GAMM
MKFHFRSFFAFNVWAGIILLMFAVFIQRAIAFGNYRDVWMLGGICFAFVGSIVYVNIIMNANLIISDEGVFREIFGVRFQYIGWGNVKFIAVTKIRRSRSSEERNVFSIVPRFRSGVKITPKGKILIGSSIEGYLSFKRVINEYLDKYSIDVKIDDGVRITKVKLLE